MIRIGYACINTRLPSPNRTCRVRNATPSRIIELARANLGALEAILEWNVNCGIELFRISSEIVPLGSHPVNKVPWRRILARQLSRIGSIIRARGLRVSMHPGQFTVLNSPRREVVASSITELEYHTAFLDALGLDRSHKVVVHMGGIYDDKNQSLKRFIATCTRLDRTVLGRLVIENDERCYSIADALIAAQKIGVPVVFDVFHHRWNPAHESLGLRGIIQVSAATWLASDGRPKIHYSNQWPGQPKGTHSRTISVQKFRDFYKQIDGLEIDVMLEVKDKERSVLKLRQSLPVLRPSRGAV